MKKAIPNKILKLIYLNKIEKNKELAISYIDAVVTHILHEAEEKDHYSEIKYFASLYEGCFKKEKIVRAMVYWLHTKESIIQASQEEALRHLHNLHEEDQCQMLRQTA